MKKQLRRTAMLCLLAMMLSACGPAVDQVETPAAMNLQRGRNYKEVIEDFEDKGFTNIRLEPIEDLYHGFTVRYEQVEQISVGGDTNYDAGVMVPANTEVVIRYHTYITSDEESAQGTTVGGQ